MKVKPLVIAIVMASTVFGGCASRFADVPAPTRFSNDDQQKLQAARHWQIIADNFAGQLVNSLGEKLGSKALYIPQPGGEQPFVEGFRELLITSLVNRGIPVALTEAGALTADVRYNIYAFRPDRVASTYFYGEATALTAGLWALGGIMAADIASASGVKIGIKALSAVAGAEGFAWVKNEALGGANYASGAVPRSEILLTVSVSDRQRIVSRYSSIYYTADEDIGLYWQRTSTTKSLQVLGDCDAGGAKCAR